MRGLFVSLFAAVTMLATSLAYAVETTAKQMILVDDSTGTVLMQKEADMRMPPSSMSKLMTAYVVFSQLKAGKLKLDDTFTVSEKAWKTQGSKMFVELGNQIKVDDLLHGMIIQSGNDACVVLAEGIAGSEEAFAEMMNKAGKEIGLKDSHFANATGWPDDNHYMTARDLATVAHHIIHEFPDYYHYYSTKEYTYHGITQGNRNVLLGREGLGVDGLKTGHTEIGGYGITLSAKDEAQNRRLILVVNGYQEMGKRAEEGEILLNHGFRAFENVTLLKAGKKVDAAEVFMGKEATVDLVSEKDALVTLPKDGASNLTFTLKYDGPVAAPIKAGQPIATLVVHNEGQPDVELPLVAGADVEKVSRFGRIVPAFKHLLGM